MLGTEVLGHRLDFVRRGCCGEVRSGQAPVQVIDRIGLDCELLNRALILDESSHSVERFLDETQCNSSVDHGSLTVGECNLPSLPSLPNVGVGGQRGQAP